MVKIGSNSGMTLIYLKVSMDCYDSNDQNGWMTGWQEASQTIDRMVYFINQSLQAVKKSNLNSEKSPCISAPEYNFAGCIDNKVEEELGCRPFWSNRSKTKVSVCQQPSQYQQHMEGKHEIFSMDEVKFREEFGCMKSCSYMEYKVRASWC